jgi:hypothetical protein
MFFRSIRLWSASVPWTSNQCCQELWHDLLWHCRYLMHLMNVIQEIWGTMVRIPGYDQVEIFWRHRRWWTIRERTPFTEGRKELEWWRVLLRSDVLNNSFSGNAVNHWFFSEFLRGLIVRVREFLRRDWFTGKALTGKETWDVWGDVIPMWWLRVSCLVLWMSSSPIVARDVCSAVVLVIWYWARHQPRWRDEWVLWAIDSKRLL